MDIKEFYYMYNAVLNDSDIHNDVDLALDDIVNHLVYDFDFVGGSTSFKRSFVDFIMEKSGDILAAILNDVIKEYADSSTDTYFTVFAFDDYTNKTKMMCFDEEEDACNWLEENKDKYASFKMYDFANGIDYNNDAIMELISDSYIVECQIEGHTHQSFAENYTDDAKYSIRDFKECRRDDGSVYLKLEYKTFDEIEAKGIFSRLASWLESEMGDAINIKCIHDVRAHDDVVKAECIYCNDGKDIIISLREKK